VRARPGAHWQGLDGLRALAVIAVLGFHFSPDTLPGGFLGVDVFFVISGYLITRLLTEEFLTNGRINVRNFYRRRARRLLPALGLVLVTVTVGALVWRDQLSTVRGGVLATAVFGGNWWLVFDHQSYFVAAGRPSMLQHLWSLGIEEQFYLLWPLVAAASLAAGRRVATSRNWPVRRGVLRLCVIAVVLSVASTVVMWILADVHNVPFGSDGSALYFGTGTHCMGLLLGAALGAWSAASPPALREAPAVRQAPAVERAIDAVGATAMCLLVLFVALLQDYSHTLYRGDFFVVSALVTVVIAVATRPASLIGRALDLPLLRWIGVRSYSLYLWHWPVTVVTRPGIDTTMPVWLDQLVRVTVTVFLADLTYRYIETPVRRHGTRAVRLAAIRRVRDGWRRMPPRLAVATPLALGVLALVAVVVIIVGPAAPTPSAAIGTTAGGQHLPLRPESTAGPRAGRTPDPNRLPKLSAFGDSVLLGARHALAAVFPGGRVDAVVGRQPDPVLADVRAAARAGSLNPLVVLHLGNNGRILPADLRQTLADLAGARLVIVLNDHLEPAHRQWQRPNNEMFDSVLPDYPNAVLVDWNRLAAEHPSWLYRDQLHLDPAGATAYAHLLASTYRRVISVTAAG
jgi:peptidoglycan/LPS O-acetylase OafA/YrhL